MAERFTLDSNLITESDLPFEYQLQTTPQDEEIWLSYHNHKQTELEKCYIIRRALQHIPGSVKLWALYLEERADLLRGLLPIGEHERDFEAVKDEFELCLSYHRESYDLWLLYLQFLEKIGDVRDQRLIFNKMLKHLPLEKHELVWEIFREFADNVKGRIGAEVYLRFLIYKPFEMELVLQKLIEFGDTKNSLLIFEQILNDETFISKVNKTPWDYYQECLDLLIDDDKTQPTLIETYIKQGLLKFPTQHAELYVTLAQYYTTKDFNRSKSLYEEALSQVKSLQQFTVLFESYTNSLESHIKTLMHITESKPEDESTATQLDLNLQILESLLDNQPYLISDLKLKNAPNDVTLWLDRLQIIPEDQIHLRLQTFVRALTTIKPESATPGLHQLWLDYSRIYEDNDDLQTAREIMDRAVKVPYNDVAELVEVWLGWANLELRRDDLETAVRVMEVATKIPEDYKGVSLDDKHLSVQRRVFKSVKLWSFYLDLKESLTDETQEGVSDVSALYEKMFELRIITPLILINYAAFLEDHYHYEESFKIYERGAVLFKYPVVFEIWNVYLTKLLVRDVSLERVREVFDRAIEGSPTEFLKGYAVLYADYEARNGSFDKSIRIIKKAVEKVPNEDKLELYLNLLSKYHQHDQISKIRETYQDIITIIPLTKCLTQLKDFIHFETQLKEFTRVRELYTYSLDQLRSRPIINDLFESWSQFEVRHGDKSTYKQMLKFKREIEQRFELRDVDYDEQDIGFVKSSDGPKVSSINASEVKAAEENVNPDSIELDI